jgi:hypothetical protein
MLKAFLNLYPVNKERHPSIVIRHPAHTLQH